MSRRTVAASSNQEKIARHQPDRFARDKAGNRIKLEIGEQRKRGRKVPLATLRCNELDRFLADRYGLILPDDDAGRADAMIYLSHLTHREGIDRQRAMHAWLDEHAPWLVDDERSGAIAKAFRLMTKYKPDTLADLLGLTYARRQRLKITTIGAIDMDKAKRAELRKAKARERMQRLRKVEGRLSHDDSISKIKPWEAAGVSRATWYRRKKAKSPYAANTIVSPISHAVVRIRLV
ncbi:MULTISPECIES: hypothetical protein [unclassified Bradyrhizobium]|uniref:hypothetical protein n=1 Tax=unclassified Bradyrhizobium TaxID=2631580 RepID=UPI002915F0B9|nr:MULTISPECIES: hypothetical protein [unclassified Bradyrhizobium]